MARAARSQGAGNAPGITGDTEPRAIVVLGSGSAAVAVAAAAAGELRARARASAALVCVWRPVPQLAEETERDAPAARSPAGATTPGARRLEARLTSQGLPATACGRLAWLVLDPQPEQAAREAERCRALVGEPQVLAIAGPRPAEFEPLLATAAICVAVLPTNTEPELQALAIDSVPGGRPAAVIAPLAPGPARWAALAGLARLRALPEPTR